MKKRQGDFRVRWCTNLVLVLFLFSLSFLLHSSSSYQFNRIPRIPPLMFWLQLLALTEKSWIILLRHPIVNLLRCLIVPIAYYVFLSYAKDFLTTSNDLGFGSPAPVRSLSSTLGSKPLYWLQGNATGNGTLYNGPVPFSAQQVMDVFIQDLDAEKRSQVMMVEDDVALGFACPQSFAGNSPCFAAIEFNSFQRRNGPENGAPIVNYTLRFAPGLDKIKIPGNNGDVELRTLPLQFALDKAIATLSTNASEQVISTSGLDQVQEWPYTWETNQQQSERQRRSLLNGVEELVVLAFFIVLLGVPWHVSSNLSSERSMGMSHLLTSAGCSQFARLLSFFTGPTAAYLPAYFLITAPLASQLFINTNTAITIAIHILPALAMAAYSIFLSAFFLRANLSAIIVTAICILGAIIGLLTKNISSGAQIIIGLIFPPATFVYAFIGISRFERLGNAANLTSIPSDRQGENNISILGQVLIACLAIVLYPILAAWVERIKYYPEPALKWILGIFKRNKSHGKDLERDKEAPSILISNLTKRYSKSSLAVSDLSFEVKRGGFTGLIGSNGSGKSSVFNCIAGTQTFSGGIFIDGYEGSDLPSGTIGLCPQKNVLYDELDARAHVRLFEKIKRRRGDKKEIVKDQNQESKQSPTSTLSTQVEKDQSDSFSQSSIDDLLLKCDLAKKFSSRPNQLSGGQKRKLQLALSIVGHSSILLVDEASSGLDPQARRAIWKILLEVNKEGRTILFTSHFLDEPDLLADDVIILTAPGEMLAHGSPIYLKETYGKGSLIHTRLDSQSLTNRSQSTFKILSSIQKICPQTYIQKNLSQDEVTFLIPSSSSDQETIGKVLKMLETEKQDLGILSYDFAGSSLENVFLTLNEDHQAQTDASLKNQKEMAKEKSKSKKRWFGIGKKSSTVTSSVDVGAATPTDSASNEKDQEEESDHNGSAALTDGRPTGLLPLAWAQFRKRGVVFRRSFMAPILSVLVAVIGSIVPLAFISDRDASCERGFSDQEFSFPVSLASPLVTVAPVIYSPESTFENVLGNSLPSTINPFRTNISVPLSSIIEQVPQTSFDQIIRNQYLNLTLGGISIVENQPPLMAYRADTSNVFEPAMVMANLISNAELARLWNSTNQPNPEAPPIINPSLRYLSSLSLDNGLGGALKWAVVFGLVQAVWPAFASLYPTNERVNGVKALALTNGQRPTPLWLGHLAFEIIVVLVASITIIGVYSVSGNFDYVNLGALWASLSLSALATVLQSFVVSLFAPSALAAFAIMAAWNVVSFLIFFAAVLLTVSYYVGSDLTLQINTIFFVTGILSPAVAASRAGWVGLNLFSLLCNGRGGFTDSGIGSITLLGGPILYSILWGVICFSSLLWVDSGSRLPPSIRQLPYLLRLRKPMSRTEPESKSKDFPAADGVSEEAERACSAQNKDLLKIQHVSKSFGSLLAVDDASFSVGTSETFSLTGINGGGKTTLHSIIRGEQRADEGTVTIDGINIGTQRTLARSKISSVPQFDGHDPTLTVYENLEYYARVKGLPKKDRRSNIEKVLILTGIGEYRDRKSRELSGGTARKLSLGIALIGNPKVLLLDELSSGIDSSTKRVLWKTLIKVASGRATLLTTHSLEEAEALGGRVAIQSSRFLGAGTISELRSKRPAYELQVDLISSKSNPLAKKFVQDLFPGAVESDEASARFEIPLKRSSSSNAEEGKEVSELTVSDLYDRLRSNQERSQEAGIRSWHISPVSLESIFLHVVRETIAMREKIA